LEHRARVILRALLAITLLQYALGVATVMGGVPLALAALHQLGACALFLLTVALVHAARLPARPVALAPARRVALPAVSPAPSSPPR
jgi:heme A synthase